MTRIYSLILKFEAIIALMIVFLLLRTLGFRSLKWHIKRGRSAPQHVEKFYNSVWKASQYMPFPCRCIEVASAVKLLASLHRIEATIVLGIKTAPFLAHAWIKSENKSYGVSDPDSYTVLGDFK